MQVDPGTAGNRFQYTSKRQCNYPCSLKSPFTRRPLAVQASRMHTFAHLIHDAPDSRCLSSNCTGWCECGVTCLPYFAVRKALAEQADKNGMVATGALTDMYTTK